jgi:hypothetical protein
MRHSLTFALAASGTALALTAAAAAAPSSSLVIQHVVKGCHSWSVDGGALAPSQRLSLPRGSALTITNNDVMPHTLVQLSGPRAPIVRIATPFTMGLKGTFPATTLAYMGARLRVSFPQPGIYVFKTRAGEDYKAMGAMKTIGEDHVLRLAVTVR